MKKLSGLLFLLGISLLSQIYCQEEDPSPEDRTFHKKKRPHNPCGRSEDDPSGRFFDHNYQINYYGGSPCGGGFAGGHKPHKKPFGGGGHFGGHGGGHFGGHGGGHFGGYNGGGGYFGGNHGGGGLFGGHNGIGNLFGGYGGYGGHKPGGGFNGFGGYRPNKIIKDINKFFKPLYNF